MRVTGQIALVFLCASAFNPSIAFAEALSYLSTPPPADKARIVFLRIKQAVGSEVGADLLEVVDDRPQYLVQLRQSEKLIWETTPGSKKFMTLGFGSAADLLFADLVGGKTYYVMLRSNPGRGSIIPTPVRAEGKFGIDSRVILNGIKTYRVVTPSADDKARFSQQRNAATVQEEYEKRNGAFQRKADAQDERTLRPEDGQ